MARLTVDQIKEKLNELGVEYDSDMLRDDLLELLEKHETADTNQEGSSDDTDGQEENKSSEDAEENETEKKQYVVVHAFKDLQDNNTVYKAKDIYPRRSDYVPDNDRLEELLSDKNKQGRPVIKEV